MLSHKPLLSLGLSFSRSSKQNKLKEHLKYVSATEIAVKPLQLESKTFKILKNSSSKKV